MKTRTIAHPKAETKVKKNFYEILKKDHRNVKQLFEQIIKGKNRDEGTLNRIARELDIHMSAEEQFLYPELENNQLTRDMALEAREEHDLGREIMGKIDNSLDDEHWLAKVKVLSDVINGHIKEEEGEMFPKSKKIIDREKEESITRSIEDEKNRGQGFSIQEGGSLQI